MLTFAAANCAGSKSPLAEVLTESHKKREGSDVKGVDVDVIIGQRGPLAPAEMCNGLVVPIVLVDQLYSFNKPELVSALARPKESAMSEKAFRGASEELFDRIQQLADNVGASDEHRALNYLSVRYQQLFAHTAAMYTRDFGLSATSL